MGWRLTMAMRTITGKKEKIDVGGGNIAVVCRFRPLNSKELASK